MTALTYVNYLGAELPPPASSMPPRMPSKSSPAEFHKGWRVVGLPPGSQQEAERMCSMTQKQFDHDHWLRTARKSSVRAKPYEVEDAARVCADLAAKAGWQGVEVRKVAKGKVAAC